MHPSIFITESLSTTLVSLFLVLAFAYQDKSSMILLSRSQPPPDLSVLLNQSKPSKRPSPFMAEVLKIAHWRFLILCNSNASVTAASSSAPGRSCLFAKMRTTAPFNSSSSRIAWNSSLAITSLSVSLESTT